MRTKNTPVQITVPHYREPLSGLVATAMIVGALVQLKISGAAGDPSELIAANGGLPAILENDVISDADWQAHCIKNPEFLKEIRMPVPVGSTCSARFAHVAEFEGADFFDAIDGSSTPGIELTTAAGKFKAAGENDRVIAHLRRKIVPHDPASFRWEVEFVA